LGSAHTLAIASETCSPGVSTPPWFVVVALALVGGRDAAAGPVSAAGVWGGFAAAFSSAHPAAPSAREPRRAATGRIERMIDEPWRVADVIDMMTSNVGFR
jgi:hypothetical protein